MNILYVSQYFPPEMGAPAARVSELARHWSEAGHRVTVLTGFPNHPTGVVAPEYRKKFRRLVHRERWNGTGVVRTWLWPLPNRKAHERILNYSSFWLSSSLTASLLPKPDVVIATSPQLLVGLTGWWLSRARRVPFVMEIRDLWPESITASGVGAQGSMFARTLSGLSGFLYRTCDRVVVVTPAFKKDIVEKYRIRPEKISIVENGVETDLFCPDGNGEAEKRELGLHDRFVVSYVGTLGLAHGLSTMLDAAAALKNEHGDIVFLLVGEGADKEHLVRSSRAKGLENVRFMPMQPRDKVPGIIRASDVCLVMLRNAPVFKTVIPTKMLEFMSCGRPVILGVDGQARKVLEQAGGGIFVQPDDPEALSRSIVDIYGSYRRRRLFGANARKFIVENLSRKHTAEVYEEVLEEVSRKGKWSDE
jgi:colanic acid biosynthesis glycosyl transferase WcaI